MVAEKDNFAKRKYFEMDQGCIAMCRPFYTAIKELGLEIQLLAEL